MIVTSTYQRRSFRIQAIQVTAENMEPLSDWCRGELKVYHPEPDRESGDYRGGQTCVEVQTGRHIKARAYVGDWISRLGEVHNYRVYKGKTFLETFEEVASELEKRNQLNELVAKAMLAQDAATYHDQQSMTIGVLEETVNKILAII